MDGSSKEGERRQFFQCVQQGPGRIGDPVQALFAQQACVDRRGAAQAGPLQQRAARRRGLKPAMQISAQYLAINRAGAFRPAINDERRMVEGGAAGDAYVDFLTCDAGAGEGARAADLVEALGANARR